MKLLNKIYNKKDNPIKHNKNLKKLEIIRKNIEYLMSNEIDLDLDIFEKILVLGRLQRQS
jgi:hypothetical protein